MLDANKTDDEIVVKVVPDTISRSFIDLRDDLGLRCRYHDLCYFNAFIMVALGVRKQSEQRSHRWGHWFELSADRYPRGLEPLWFGAP